MTREKKLSLCSRGDALKESSHPDPLIFDNGPPDGSAWYLELIKEIEQPTVSAAQDYLLFGKNC